jgi:type I restriction enzyme S subunit
MNIVKITDVCDFQGGTQPPKSDWIKDPKSGYIRMLQIRDFTQRQRNNIEYVKEKATLKTCNEDDILIGRYGASIGKICDGLKGAYNVALVKTIPNKKLLNRDFLLYVLKGDDFQNFIQNIGSRAAQAGFNKADLEGFQFPLPPLPQQQKIANILDAADALRQKDKALLTKYDQLTQALFLDMFGDVVNNQKNWEFISFGTVFKSIRYGTSTPPNYIEKGIPFIRATNVKKGTVVEKGMTYISELEASKIEKCKLKEGDLIVVRSGANTGDCCRIPYEYKDAYGGFDLIIDIDEPYSTFYNFLLNTKAGKSILDPLTRRAGQPHLNSKQMTELELLNPPISLQNQFAERVQVIEHQKAIAQKSLEKSEELFNSLLQKAFKGELI